MTAFFGLRWLAFHHLQGQEEALLEYLCRPWIERENCHGRLE